VPTWLYEISSLRAALLLVGLAEFLSLVGLLLTRRYLIPKFHFGEGINDAISGTVQAIGVFYGITVGLIAVAVWNSNTSASNLVSGEATSIAGLYRDVNGYPSPIREELREIPAHCAGGWRRRRADLPEEHADWRYRRTDGH